MTERDIDYGKVFEVVPRITGLPLRRKGKNWMGKCYINGAPHRYRDDKLVVSRDPSGGIVLLEQGGESMQLWKWLREYGGCSDDREVADRLREMTTGVLYIPPPPEPPPALYVPSHALEAARGSIGLVEDNLFAWLCTKRPRAEVISAFKRYNVTPHRIWDGRIATQFWCVDEKKRVCHDKLMVYHENGRRDKTYGGGRVYKTGDGYSHRCYFGEHLLPGHQGQVYVVESEKTALLTYIMTGRLCLATGGSKNIHRIKRGYRLMPDWDEAGMEWVDKFPPEMIVRWWENEQYEGQAKPGDDFGDVIYKRLMGYE